MSAIQLSTVSETMAKENFERTKPHVNIGHTATLEDSARALSVDDPGSETEGNPAPSSVLVFSAPATSSAETATVAFPVDDVFVFDPARSGDAVSFDFQLDVLPSTVDGTPDVEIAFAILQDEPFIASRSAGSIDGTESDWTTIGQGGLLVKDFIAVDGGPERPDFSRPFQFGYAFTGKYSTSALSVDLGLDNMFVEITTVPEPSSIMLALAMGVSLWWHRWCSGDEESKN